MSDKQSIKREVIQLIENLADDSSIEEIYRAVSVRANKEPWRSPIPRWLFALSGVLAFGTFIYFVWSYFYRGEVTSSREKDGFSLEDNTLPLLDYLFYVVWIIGPPSYFLFEYICKFPYKLDNSQMQDMKYTQELASKVWAALLVAYGVILFAKYQIR